MSIQHLKSIALEKTIRQLKTSCAEIREFKEKRREMVIVLTEEKEGGAGAGERRVDETTKA